MKKSKLIKAEIVISVAEINCGYIPLSEVKSKDAFFNAVRQILSDYTENLETCILDWHPVSDDLEVIDYEVIEPQKTNNVDQSLKDQIQIIQANISKKGYLTFYFDPSLGPLSIETEEFCGFQSLKEIRQGGNDIDYEVEDYGRPNEELLSYVVCLQDGSVKTDQVDAYFSIDPDEDPDEETDGTLREITDSWYESIFH